MNRTKTATWALGIPGTMSLGFSALTSFTYLGTHLGITANWERGALCAVAESGILALSVHSWATGKKSSEFLALALVGVQGVPAFEVSPGLGGIVRLALGPALVMVLAHLILGLDLKIKARRANTLLSQTLREVRERVTAYLGIGARGADSAAIARSRAADKAVRLASHKKTLAGKPGYLARLASAIDGAQHGLTGEEAREAESRIVGRINRQKSVSRLANLKGSHRWTETSHEPTPVSQDEPALSPEPSPVSQDEPVMIPSEPAMSPEPSPVSQDEPVSNPEPVVSQDEPSQVNPVIPVEPSLTEEWIKTATVDELVALPPTAHVTGPEPMTKAQRITHVAQRIARGERMSGAQVSREYGVSPATGKRDMAQAKIEAQGLIGTGMYA